MRKRPHGRFFCAVGRSGAIMHGRGHGATLPCGNRMAELAKNGKRIKGFCSRSGWLANSYDLSLFLMLNFTAR